MTNGPKQFTAEIDAWVLKTKKRAKVIVQQSAHDVFQMASRIKPGMNRGGDVMPGFLPRDTGFLAGSAKFEINDSPTAEGENIDFAMSIVGMEAGDTAVLAWTAVYARAQHYKGWLWVDTAASQWQQIVADNVARAKAQVRG